MPINASLPQELLRKKRMGGALSAAEISELVTGITDGSLKDAQVGALAMAICTRGMSAAETTALTLAMRDSGQVLEWHAAGFDAPILDKHSTGGVGDLVSLALGPMLAACGAYVPMLSGRGLGHTGGTLDKLEAIPGYQVEVGLPQLRDVLREAGVAIVGAGADLAPADRRLYGIRDITGTVESIALISASILSKKLAAHPDALVLDIKTGSGALMPTLAAARELAVSLVDIAARAGLPARALISDMNQALAPSVGNALEVHCALRYLRGDARPARLHQLTVQLGAELLCMAGIASDAADAQLRLLAALDSGAAALRFARMVVALGGPLDLLENADKHLPIAPVIGPVFAQCEGWIGAVDARALGLAVVGMGGGRTRPGQAIDYRVGLDRVAELGSKVDAHTPLAIIHAADAAAHARAAAQLRAAFSIGNSAVALPTLVYECVHATP